MKNSQCLHRGIAALTFTMALATSASAAKPDDGESEKNLAMGVVAKIDADTIVIRKEGKGGETTLKLSTGTKISYVGFKGLGQSPAAPQPGYGVKANTTADGIIKTALFAPPIPPLTEIPEKHKLTVAQLFAASDQNKNGRVDYVEYATWIFQSYKHLPDRWTAKLDTNGDDTLDLQEFEGALALLDWWRLSRKTAEEWVKTCDQDHSGGLDIQEALAITNGAHGKQDELFKKLDSDKSGALSPAELQSYLDANILVKTRKKNK